MKMLLKETYNTLIDLDIERKRINKSFRNDPIPKAKLHKLMDLIENERWREARKFLDSKWWQGYDRKSHCARLEFVGVVRDISGQLVRQMLGYDDLITRATVNLPYYKFKVEKKYE